MKETTPLLSPDPETPEEPIFLDHEAVVDTIIVSDVHLGSSVSRSKRLLELLRAYSYHRLILNGDVFDDLNFNRLTKEDWRFLSYIRKMSNPKRGVNVVWVIGNHDGGVAEILSHLLGVPVHEEYVWEAGGLRCLAIHGHQFDKWITEHVVVTAVASTLYSWLQRLDPEHRVSRWVKRTSKKWLRLSDKVANDAIEHGRKHHGADIVFCGHTHQFTDRVIGRGRYINSGCWTDKPSQYVTISLNGEITLRQCL
ncbi:MAG: UDP-2,3-diacylglucosamine diphosphatase [bacterium]|nr:UDP-2,3-diacylglucosamine diphosphatase [bacterium]